MSDPTAADLEEEEFSENFDREAQPEPEPPQGDPDVHDEGNRAPVRDRFRKTDPKDLPQGGSPAARLIARRRRFAQVPWILAGILFVTTVVQPVLYMISASRRREIVLMDSNSNFTVSPFVTPMENSQVQQICFTWAAKGLLDRNPNGFTNTTLLDSYFLPLAREKAQQDWQSQEAQAQTKQIFQDFDAFRFQVQPYEGGRLRVRIDGQLRVTAIDNGTLVTQPRPQAVELVFTNNPNLGRNRFFPLIVESWRYLQDPAPLPGI